MKTLLTLEEKRWMAKVEKYWRIKLLDARKQML